MLLATAALAHHPTGVAATGGAGPINTISASTLDKGQSSASIMFEIIKLDPLSDAFLANFGATHGHDQHVHSLSSAGALDLVLELNGEWHSKTVQAGVTDANSGGAKGKLPRHRVSPRRTGTKVRFQTCTKKSGVRLGEERWCAWTYAAAFKGRRPSLGVAGHGSAGGARTEAEETAHQHQHGPRQALEQRTSKAMRG